MTGWRWWSATFRSFSFRLVLLYAVTFCLSVALLFAITHWIAIERPLEIVRATVRAEARTATEIERAGGRPALMAYLHQRGDRIAANKAYHLVITADGRVIATNLPSWPRGTLIGWHMLEADIFREGEELDHMALLLGQRLADGTQLVVGRDIEAIDQFGIALERMTLAIIVITVLLGSAGGILMSRAIARRIEGVNRIARRVMDGQLSERIPLRATGDDFDQLAETLNRMLGRIEGSVEMARRVSDNVAHELRTRLARLQANLEDLDTTSDLPPSCELLVTRSLEEGQRLQSVFNALLRIARIESGCHDSHHRLVDLSDIVRDAVELYAIEAEERRIAFVVHADAPVTVVGDPDLLFQAVSNLLDNAIKYTEPGGCVRVTATAAAVPAIRIHDNGPGVAAVDIPRLGERFFRAANAVHRPGTGLGLSLVHAVAIEHRSDLSFDGERGFCVNWQFSASRLSDSLSF